MKRIKILTVVFVTITLLSAKAQSGTLEWHDIESKANRTIIYTSAADNNSVFYINSFGMTKNRDINLIRADYNFKNLADINTSISGQKEASRVSVLDAKNGNILGLETTTGFVKSQFPISLKYGLLDANLKMISEPMPLKMATDAMLPIYMMDMLDYPDNRYFMTLKQNDQFVYCYLYCSDQKGNLQVGIARFDADYNLVSNDLTEIPMPANKVFDARLAADANFDSYYLLIKEIDIKSPKSRFIVTNGYSGNLYKAPNEERVELSTVYRIHDGKVAGSFALTDYKSQTPDIKVMDGGRLLVVGLAFTEKGNKIYGLYSFVLDSELKNNTISKLPFSDMIAQNNNLFAETEKGSRLIIKHLELLKLESNYVAHFELKRYEDYSSTGSELSSRDGYVTLATYDDVFSKLDTDGKFTGLAASVAKEQSESVYLERFAGSIVYVAGNTINVLFNDTPENLKAGDKLERWSSHKMKKEESIVRRIVFDQDMKKVSDEVVNPKGSLAIMPTSSWSDSARTVIFAADNETTYGTVIVH